MSHVKLRWTANDVDKVADGGAHLSTKLYTFAHKVNNFDQSISDLSNQIAATGAALTSLGDTLGSDSYHYGNLASETAVDTINQIVADCWRVFTSIHGTVTVGGDELLLKKDKNAEKESPAYSLSKTPSFGFKQLLRFPYHEPQINILKAKLESLKSSLMVMIEALLLAEQIRQRPISGVSQSHKSLIRTLLHEHNEKEANFRRSYGHLVTTSDPPATHDCHDSDDFTLIESSSSKARGSAENDNSNASLQIFIKDSNELNDADELREIIRSLGGELSDADFEQYIQEHHKNGTRSIDSADSLRLLHKARLLTTEQLNTALEAIRRGTNAEKGHTDGNLPLAVVEIKRQSRAHHLKAVKEYEAWEKQRPPTHPKVGVASTSDVEIYPRWSRALYAHTTEKKPELSFIQDEDLELLAAVDAHWFIARSTQVPNAVGFAPCNYIKLLPMDYIPDERKGVDQVPPSTPEDGSDEDIVLVEKDVAGMSISHEENEEQNTSSVYAAADNFDGIHDAVDLLTKFSTLERKEIQRALG